MVADITDDGADEPPVPDRGSEPSDLQVPAAFADLIGYHLRIAQEASFAAIRKGGGKAELKPGWYTMLTILQENPGIAPSELSRLSGRDRSTLTTTLKDLATRGLISRRRKAHDQRSYTIRLTADGEAMLTQVRAYSRQHDARLDAIVGDDKARFIAVLRRIVEGLAPEAPLPRSAEPASPEPRPAPDRTATARRAVRKGPARASRRPSRDENGP
jgi:DNA-binding MarR family transcriptional regulator